MLENYHQRAGNSRLVLLLCKAMNKPLYVFKFGGASVKNAGGIRNLSRILSMQPDADIICVISAMGKTTNALEELCRLAFVGLDAGQAWNAIAQSHLEAAYELGLDDNAMEKLQSLLHELKEVANSAVLRDNFDGYYDKVVSYGEKLSTLLVFLYLNAQGFDVALGDATRLILTDNLYREAIVNEAVTEENLRYWQQSVKAGIKILQGFIGANPQGYATTLGREGSDYTAALVASMLNAESVTVWKDVDGVLTADPRIRPDAQKFEKLSYHDAAEMTYYGAVVIHPKTIFPLAQKGIPLYVKPFEHPEQSGTCITYEQGEALPTYIYKFEQVLVSLATEDSSFIHERHLGHILQVISEMHVHVNMMQISATSFSLIFDYRPEKVEKLIELLGDSYQIRYNTGLRLLTVKHYLPPFLYNLREGKEILIEQRTRNTLQILYKSIQP
jgi:aspartate kinase